MDYLIYIAIGLPFGVLGAAMTPKYYEIGGPVFNGFLFWAAWPLVIMVAGVLLVLSPFIWLFSWLGDRGR